MKYRASEATIRAAKIAGLGRVPDAEVAKILGVSRQRVHQIRMAAGLDAPGDKAARKAAERRACELRRLAREGLTMTEAAARLGMTYYGLAQSAQRHGVAFTRDKMGVDPIVPDWSIVDWTQRNVNLAASLGVAVQTVTQMRRTLRLLRSRVGRLDARLIRRLRGRKNEVGFIRRLVDQMAAAGWPEIPRDPYMDDRRSAR